MLNTKDINSKSYRGATLNKNNASSELQKVQNKTFSYKDKSYRGLVIEL